MRPTSALKKLKAPDGTEWDFSGDSERCFAVNNDETKATASSADVTVTVASWRELKIPGKPVIISIFGKLRLQYKIDGGKWVLENVEAKELIYNPLETEQFEKFVDIQMPLCKYYRHTK